MRRWTLTGRRLSSPHLAGGAAAAAVMKAAAFMFRHRLSIVHRAVNFY